MAERIFDIHLELDPMQLALEHDPRRAIAELAREAAVQFADQHHLRLRHPEPIEVHSSTGVSYATGVDVLVVAARWVGDPC